ncbi:hypothetical protein [Carnimonas bestiolae]|uniref:hypothetical protein n=1 Tax=Carnimonas bestiolae TaxID=3402172 RepID=UPI003EDC5321
MPSDNRKKIVVDVGNVSLMYPAIRLAGFDDIGLVSVGSDTGRLIKNTASGVYAMHIRGAIRSLDQRKVKAALGIRAGRPTEMDGGKRRNIYMSDADTETARLIGDGNLSEGIRIAINAYQQK